MAVVSIAWTPSRQAYQAVRNKVGGPPAWPAPGLIVHTASEVDGKVRIVEVWESQQHIDEFVQSKLVPVFQGLGVNAEPPELTETFSIDRG